MSGQGKRCEVCGKDGKAASKCAFEKACSCWYGVPCVNGESMRETLHPKTLEQNGA